MSYAPTITFRPASDKQIALINKLLIEKLVDDRDRETITFDMEQGLSTKGASQWIDIMFRFPRAPKPMLDIEVTARPKATELGFYKAEDGEVYKIVDGMNGRYAKRTTAHGLQYERGAITKLFADQKMTGEEIAAHGVANRYCVNCSHDLEDPTSKRIGLGTSCGPQILGKDGYKAARASVTHFEDVVAWEAAKKAEAKERREAKKIADAQLVLV